MSDYARTLERMLRENGFVLQPGRKHRVYRSERLGGRIFVTAATPSDSYRAIKNAISTLQKVIDAPPRSEFTATLEFEKAQAEGIQLARAAQVKAGARGLAKTKGTGFTYYSPDDKLSAEEKALKRLKAEEDLAALKVMREQRRMDDAAVGLILKDWEEIIGDGEARRFVIHTLEPLCLKKIVYTKVSFKNVTITDVWTCEEIRLDSGTKFFGRVIYRDGKITTVREEYTDGRVTFGCVSHPDGVETVERTKYPDGATMFETAYYPDGRITHKRVQAATGGVGFDSIAYPDGRNTLERIEYSDGRVAFGAVAPHGGEQESTFERVEYPDGRIEHNVTVSADGTRTVERVEHKELAEK